MAQFSGEYAVSGSMPQETAGWEVRLHLTQSGTDLEGRFRRTVSGYDPERGYGTGVTDEGNISGRVEGDIAVIQLGTLAFGEARFRRTADGIQAVHINAYHGGLDREWRRMY